MGKLSRNPTAATAVRFAIPLLVACLAVALVACDSGDDGAASPVPQDSGELWLPHPSRSRSDSSPPLMHPVPRLIPLRRAR